MGTKIMLFTSLGVVISYILFVFSLRSVYLFFRFIKSTKLPILVVSQCISHTSCLPSCPDCHSGHSAWVDKGMIYPQEVLWTPFESNLMRSEMFFELVS